MLDVESESINKKSVVKGSDCQTSNNNIVVARKTYLIFSYAACTDSPGK